MKTTRDIFNRALTLLGVLAAGQTAEAEDWAVCREAWRPLQMELRAIGVCNIVTHPTNELSEDIPEAAFNPLAYLLANEVAPSFGIPPAGLEDRDKLIKRLSRVVVDPYNGYVQDAEYY